MHVKFTSTFCIFVIFHINLLAPINVISCRHYIKCLLSLVCLLILLFLLGGTVLSNYHGVIALVGLQRKLLQRFEVLVLQFADFPAEDGLRRGGGIDTTGLDGDHAMSSVLEKVVRVEGHDAGLIGLGDVGEDAVDHTDEHAVFEGMARVLDDGDDVGARFGHVDEVAAGSVGELDGVDGTGGSDNVGHVRDGGAGRGTKIQYLGSRLDPDIIDTTKNGGSDCARGLREELTREC